MPVSNVARIAAAGAIAMLCAGGASWAETANEVGSPHLMTVQLPDGGVAQITYYGNFAPQIVVAPPAAMPAPAFIAGDAYAPADPFAALDRMAAVMDAQAAMMMRQAAFMATHAVSGGGLVDANVASLPAGATSTTYVASFNGNGVCARSTEMVSAGPGMRPRVVSYASGDCGSAEPAPVRNDVSPSASTGARTIRVRADQPAMLRPAVIYTPAE